MTTIPSQIRNFFLVTALRRFQYILTGFSLVILFAFQSSLIYAESPLVVVATYEGVINPVAAEYLDESLMFAEANQADLLVFQLDTPGGLDTSMRIMVKAITSSQIPVAVYVAPTGARAASAGVFLTLAAHIAAMAPGTNIGAAHPVAMGGEKMDTVMKEKVENDAAAYIHSIAERRGRNTEWAENAVRKSVSATAKQALDLQLIDVFAATLPQLLKKIDGREVHLNTQLRTLHTSDAQVKEFPMTWRLQALKALSDPNIAYVLMTIGTIGIIAELYNPGAILPGVVGGISLILAFYSLQSLPVNYAGVLLLILGLVMLILEATVTSYGILAIGGITSLLLGSLMLMREEFPFYQLSWSVILPVVILGGGLTFLIVTFGVKSLRTRTSTGSEGLIGMTGVAKTDLIPSGQILVHGEIWEATSEEPLTAGAPIQVTGIDGLTLHVKPLLSGKKET